MAKLPHQELRSVAIPSRSLRSNADPRATEVQLQDADGVPHYRVVWRWIR